MKTAMNRVCVIGCGRLGAIVARGLKNGAVPGAELTGVMGRTGSRSRELAAELGCPAAENVEELLALKPDYVIEAATGACVRQYAEVILAGGANLIVISTGAFGDADFRRRVAETAERYDRRVRLASGVVGGFDIMETACLAGELTAAFTKCKPASASGKGDPALRNLSDEFHGTAAEAYQKFPDHLNVAVSVALGTCGVDRTVVHVGTGESVNFTTELSGAFGKAKIYTELGTEGPDMAAWSALAVLKRDTARISF